MMSLLSGFIDRALAVVGVLVFTQIPLYYQQYVSKLSGHLSEIELQITVLKQTAARTGKTLQAYIEKFLAHSDQDVASQGQFMQGMLDRLDHLRNAYTQLTEAPIWAHPLYLLRYGDSEIASSTFSQFEPGLSFSLESLVYGLIGLAFGLGLFKLLRWVFSPIRRLWNHHGNVAPNPTT